MRKLTQDIFKGAPEWVKSAHITRRDIGCVFGINKTVKEYREWQDKGSLLEGFDCELLGMDYKAYFWQKSAIDREFEA